MTSDILFTNVMMYDGSGKPGIITNVGVTGSKISYIGNENIQSKRIIDCTGLSMIPGMIDVHTHTDFAMYNRPERDMAVSQGVTTEITSACGIGAIPLKGKLLDDYLFLMKGLTGERPGKADFESVDAYLSGLPDTGVNVAVQIAHSPIRAAAAGTLCDVTMTDEIQKKMEQLEREAFEQGAVSISTGMSYYPATFCDTDELVKICRVAKEYDAPMTVHRRGTLRRPDPNFSSRQEMIDVAKKSGATVIFSHYRTGPGDEGQAETIYGPIEKARNEGIDLYADFYPYEFGCSYAATVLPLSAMQEGPYKLIERLNSPWFEELVARTEKNYGGYIGGRFARCPKHPEYLGRTFREVAKETGESTVRLFMRVLKEENLDFAYIQGCDESKELTETLSRDFAELISKPFYSVGSDTIPAHPSPHPRAYGAFARILEIAREQKVDLSVIADRTAALPAKLYGIKDRGMIKVGMYADLAVFDHGKIHPNSTYANPNQLCTGMKYVTVNGRLEMDDGRMTGVKAGMPIRRNR